MMLLYGLILIPFNYEQTPLLFGSGFLAEMTEGSSSDLSSIQIYYSEFDSEFKIYSENGESNKQKKNEEKQFYVVSSCSDFATNEFTSENEISKVKNCNSQADFNYTSHSFW